jgi:hypothetical protein
LNENFPAYHLCTAQTFHSNFTLRLKKKLVGFSHYGHFSYFFDIEFWVGQLRFWIKMHLKNVCSDQSHLCLRLEQKKSYFSLSLRPCRAKKPIYRYYFVAIYARRLGISIV